MQQNPRRSPFFIVLLLVQFIGLLGYFSNTWSKDLSVEELETTVVTASPIPRTSSQTSASVTIIPRAEIDRQHANRLSGILQQVPGIFVDEMGGRGGTSSVYIRGGDPNFTLVMIDGIPLNDPNNQRGGSVDLSMFTPERIARIEVLRGPASVQYGSDAMAGIINLITHTGHKQSIFRTLVESGRFGYTRGVLHTDGSKQHIRYSGTASTTRNDSMADGDSFFSGNVGGSLDWSIRNDVRLRFTSQYSNTSTQLFPEGSGGSRFAILRDLEDRQTNEVVAGFTLSHDLSQHVRQDWMFNFFYRQQDVDNPGVKNSPTIFEIPPTCFATTFTRYRFGGTVSTTIEDAWNIAGGWQVIAEQGQRSGIQQLTALGLPMDLSNAFQTARITPAGFLEGSFSPTSYTSLSFGTRIDSPEGFPITVNPRASVILHPTSYTTLRANYGHGFKLPSFNALSDPVTGNPSLRPESSRSWDVGFQLSMWSSQLALEFTYFHNRFKNLIDLDPLLADQGTFTLVNLNSVVTHGVELGVTATLHSSLTIKGSITQLESDILGSDAVLRNRPRVTGNGVIAYQPTSTFAIRGQIRAVSQRTDFQVPTRETRVPGFVRTDLSATYGVTEAWKIFGVIENLLNASYEEYAGFSAPGIWFRFGLSYGYEN